MNDEQLKSDMLSLIRMRPRDIRELSKIWKDEQPERLSRLVLEMVESKVLEISPEGSTWYFRVASDNAGVTPEG